MAGLFSLGGLATLAGRRGWSAAKGLGQGIWSSPSGRATAIGAGVGAAWGAISDDTSVLGGALGGAFAGRYGSAAWRGTPMAGMGLKNSYGVMRKAWSEGTFGRRLGAQASSMWGGLTAQGGADLASIWGGGGRAWGWGKGQAKAAAARVRGRMAPKGASVASNQAVNPVASSFTRGVGDVYDYTGRPGHAARAAAARLAQTSSAGAARSKRVAPAPISLGTGGFFRGF